MESSTAIMTPMMAEESDDPNDTATAVSEIDENSQIRNLSKDTEASPMPMASPQTILSFPLCPQASFRDPPSHMKVPSAPTCESSTPAYPDTVTDMMVLNGTMRIDRASQNSEDQPTDVVEAVTSPDELQAQLQSTIMYFPISAFASPETAISQLEVPPWYHPGEIHALPRIGSRAAFPNLEASLSRTEHDFHNRHPIHSRLGKLDMQRSLRLFLPAVIWLGDYIIIGIPMAARSLAHLISSADNRRGIGRMSGLESTFISSMCSGGMNKDLDAEARKTRMTAFDN
ncbi:uncharacterized protein RSE6_08321 [Rhynchosporium secalis]|uniref:Uncharacterized protein n=1 Tax=Rhynchosporium secalis TaxID=38038 RepID=A0A1E1MG85_RHYSE|nr:uncharacterized protein RSE6_08321 [Rhynchosporium secalis]